MIGILILAHGSREKQTEHTMDLILSSLQKKLPETYIEKAFLQFSETNLEKSIQKMVDQGITDIKVVPYFLFEGVHIREDIPNEIRQLSQRYPDVRITMGRTLGADPRLADILADRVKELT